MDIFSYDIGTFSFFVFSFLAALFIVISALFGCKEETNAHRWVRGALGLAYLLVTYIAFTQLEGTYSPYQQAQLERVESERQSWQTTLADAELHTRTDSDLS